MNERGQIDPAGLLRINEVLKGQVSETAGKGTQLVAVEQLGRRCD
jgi:hypothetical protein